MKALDKAKYLNESFGFNVIPLLYLRRDDEGKKDVGFIGGYAKYRSEEYDLTTWPKDANNLAIITGEISNLTIVDIDSLEAKKSFENSIGKSIEEVSDYVVKTTKGYQLFYSYESTIKAKIGIKDYIDLLNDGRQTFADELNDGYTLIKGGKPSPMPEAVKDLFAATNTKITKSFLSTLQEENQLTYKNPLSFKLEDYVNAKRLTKKIMKPLEKRFCTGGYEGLTIEEASKPGRKHDFNVHVAGICAIDPTVDETLYYEFLYDFAERTIKTTRSRDELSNVGGFDYVYNTLFDYNPKWLEFHEKAGSTKAITSEAKIKVWYDPIEDKYKLYDLETKHIDVFSKPAFKDDYMRRTSEDIDVATVPRIYQAFEPQINEEFFTGEDGREFHNSFKRTELMEYFLVCEPQTEMPPFIEAIVKNVFPNEKQMKLFLHNLAYHIKYLTYANTLFLSTGKTQGTGKNLLYDGVLKLIYGKYHLTWKTEDFVSNFNGELKNKLIVHGNDIKEKNTPYATTTLGNVIKVMVANETIGIHAKGKQKEEVPNHIMLLMSSNEVKPFTVDEGENRRLNVFPTSTVKLEDAYKNTPSSQPEIKDKLEVEIRDFVAYLASIKLDSTLYKTNLKTAQSEVMIGRSTIAPHKIAQAMMEQDLQILEEECEEDFVDFYKAEVIERNISYITASALKHYLPQQRKQITDYLKLNGVEYGIQGIPREKKTGLLYVINPKGTKHEELPLKKDPKL
jgi:hypothetical protein